MNDDLVGVEEGVAADIPIDDSWGEQFAGGEELEEDAPRTSDQTIPQFPYYVVRFNFGRGRVIGKTEMPLAGVGAVIKEGPEGTIGERVFDDLFLKISEMKTVDGVRVEKSAEEFKKGTDFLTKIFNKVARIGKFPKAYPTDFPGDSKTKADCYAKQFEATGGFDAIIEVTERADSYRGGGARKNRFDWLSMRALDDPAHLKRSAAGSSALDEAREKIEAANKVLIAKASKDGQTAGSVSRKPGTLND